MSFRLLQPLRTLSVLSSIRAALRSIVVSLKQLANVVALSVIFAIAAGVVALTFFKGQLGFRCHEIVIDSNGTATSSIVPDSPVCSWSASVDLPSNLTYASSIFNGGKIKALTDIPATSPGYVCGYGHHCLPAINPGHGFISFDTIFNTMITLFSVMCLEDWSSIMYMLMDASSWFVSWFFIAVVIIGTIFIMNLALAIVSEAFSRSIAEEERLKQEPQEEVSNTTFVAWAGMVVSQQLEASALKDKKCCDCFHVLRRFVHDSVLTKRWFEIGGAVAAVINTVVLATIHYGMSPGHQFLVDVANIVFTIVFTIEIVLKLIGLNFAAFRSDSLNIFDLFVTILALIELVVVQSGYIIVFRSIRLLRVLQLSNSLKITIDSLFSAGLATLSLVVLLIIVVFLFALLGVQLFSGSMCEFDTTSVTRVNTSVCDSVPRANFDHIGYAMVTTFIIIAGDGWRSIMVNGMRASGEWCSIYFCGCFLVGGYLLLNLFVAVLLEKKREEPKAVVTPKLLQGDTAEAFSPSQTPHDVEMSEFPTERDETEVALLQVDPREEDAADCSKAPSHGGSKAEDSKSGFQRSVGAIVSSLPVALVVTCALATSIASLMLLQPRRAPDTMPWQYVVTKAVDVSCGMIFAVEALLKLMHLGLGLPGNSHGYFRRPWLVFDFLLMLCGLVPMVNFFWSPEALQPAVGPCRLTRGLRALSLAGRLPWLGLVFEALMNSLPSIRNVSVIVTLVWIVYGILGTSLFNGALHACTKDEWGDMSFGEPFLSTKDSCLKSGYSWETNENNFDNLGRSLLTMFQVATVDNWFDPMFLAMDSVSDEEAPKQNTRVWVVFYFTSFVVVVSFFLLNFFVSIMIETYFVTKSKLEKREVIGGDPSVRLNDNQRTFLRMYRRALTYVKPPLYVVIPHGSLRCKTKRIVRHRHFELGCLIFALLHVIAIATQHAEEPPLMQQTLFAIDGGCTLIFCIITAMRLFVLRGIFFDHKRNTAELVINAITSIAILVEAGIGSNLPCELLRNLRVLRLYRVLFVNASMRLILETLKFSGPTYLSVFVLLSVVYYTYAVGGMLLFGKVAHAGKGINANVNFERFDVAMLTLLRVSTVDEWAEVMWGCALEEPHCSAHRGDCGRPVVAQIFFVTFVIICNWIGINFFTAVLMESFCNAEEEERFALQHEDVAKFQQLWKSQTDDDSAMAANELPGFLMKLGFPFAPLNGKLTKLEALRLLAEQDSRTIGGYISQHEVFDMCVRYFYGMDLPLKAEKELRKLVASQFQARYFEKQSPLKGRDRISMRTIASAMRIQAAWRRSRDQPKQQSKQRLSVQRLDHSGSSNGVLRTVSTMPRVKPVIERTSSANTLEPDTPKRTASVPIRDVRVKSILKDDLL